MTYVMSDLHGNYEKYSAMLEKINFRDCDIMYILGDVTDRGEEGIKILLDMMNYPNIIPMLGNHELMAYSVLSQLNTEVTENNVTETMSIWHQWMQNGGEPTQQAFLALDEESRSVILEYLEEFSVYETVSVNGNDFFLVHAGLKDFDESKSPDEYNIHDMMWERADYNTVYFSNKYLVTGHTPTFLINEAYRGKIYQKNNHIALDCGVSSGENLGCICLDTLEEFYV